MMGVRGAGKFICTLPCSRGTHQRRACVQSPNERSTGSKAGWCQHHLKEGRASFTKGGRKGITYHGSRSTPTQLPVPWFLQQHPSTSGDVGLPPTHHPHCFPWHSTRSLACTWQCHPLIHGPGEVTHLLRASRLVRGSDADRALRMPWVVSLTPQGWSFSRIGLWHILAVP